ncbi:hypothetical protein BGX33_003736 [Mortierella sp. NVP41]|nr:hypothetical protein BGX33_003736 [Mortierella sp. NVP41]
MGGNLNDWDMLLPSGDPYENINEDVDEDDDGMNENERSEEKHLGGYIRDYLQGNFVVDIHPPLGKMLFSLVVYLFGYNGKFDFMSGKLYPSNVPFIGMRMFAAGCGVGLIPISYLTIKRFTALDAPMMLFMGYTLLTWVNFYNHRNRPFTRGWWTWLLQTGVGLFLSSSVKWVGSFTIVTIDLCALKYLQESRKYLYLSTRDFSKQITALLLCLLVLPALLYMGLYAVDFQLLSKSGLGDSWVSPQFRMTLKGHDVEPVMADIAWLSKIHIRHANSNGGWVHSTPGEYARDGAIEWDDDLTCWQVHPADPAVKDLQQQNYIDREKNPSSVPFEGYIYDGDLVGLKHCYTKVALSAFNLESIGFNKSFIREVRGIPWKRESSEETTWRIELVPEGSVPGLVTKQRQPATLKSEEKDASREQWHSIKGFRLFNEQWNCYLMSHKIYRATYSSYQEVGCIQENRQKANTIFVVDRNANPHLPASTPSHSYQPLNFFQKFIEINKVMWWSHHDLSPPFHASHDYYTYTSNTRGSKKRRRADASHPWSRLFLGRGLNYYSSKETNNYVYLLGNPVLWWAASSTAVPYVLGCLWSVLGFIRGNSNNQKQQQRARFGLIPFYTIAPGTFSLYFSILLLVSRLDRTWQSWSSRKLRYTTGILFVLAVIFAWYSLAPLAYDTDFSSRRACEQARSFGGWEFVCQRENLPLARPQDAIARIVVERRADHDAHAEQEERENSQFYYQEQQQQPGATTSGQQKNDRHDHERDHSGHDHDGVGKGEERDHEGPFNEDESEHYDHEHFHHPPGHHQADDEHGHHHHGHGHAIHNPASELHHHDSPPPSPPFDEQQQQQQQQQDSSAPIPGTVPDPATDPDETKKKSAAKKGRMDRMIAVAMQQAQATTISNQQKEKLAAEKLALEARQRELDEQLRAQELQEKEEMKLEQERQGTDEQERQRVEQEQLRTEQRQQREREERERRETEEREEQEKLRREEKARLLGEEQELRRREEQERLQREEQERQEREAQEQREREEQDRQQREDQERQRREEQERQQREDQLRRECEAQEQQEREQAEQHERQAAGEAAAVAATAEKEQLTREMLEEQVRILQAQVDSHRARSFDMAQQQQQ